MSCVGAAATDKSGDMLSPPPAPSEPNIDLTSFFFVFGKDAESKPKLTANVKVAD